MGDPRLKSHQVRTHFQKSLQGHTCHTISSALGISKTTGCPWGSGSEHEVALCLVLSGHVAVTGCVGRVKTGVTIMVTISHHLCSVVGNEEMGTQGTELGEEPRGWKCEKEKL